MVLRTQHRDTVPHYQHAYEQRHPSIKRSAPHTARTIPGTTSIATLRAGALSLNAANNSSDMVQGMMSSSAPWTRATGHVMSGTEVMVGNRSPVMHAASRPPNTRTKRLMDVYADSKINPCTK